MGHLNNRAVDSDNGASLSLPRSGQGTGIRPLPQDVVAQIKSSAAITSLGGVVLELLKNSLDAGASKVEIFVDFSKGACTVEDNGLGIEPREFEENGGLLKLYHTSRHDTDEETYGRYGTFLASVAALSLLSVTSHHHQYRSHNTLTVHRSKPIARLLPAPVHHELVFREHGTKISVSDLFGNFPVRVKQRAAKSGERAEHDRLWDELKRDLLGLLIAWGRPVTVKVRAPSRSRLFSLNTARAVLAPRTGIGNRIAFDQSLVASLMVQASYAEFDDLDAWVPVSASTSMISIEGIISMTPAPSKRTQFISLGITPLPSNNGANEPYAEVNRLFHSSGFGVESELPDFDESEKERRQADKQYKLDAPTNDQLRNPRKAVDRFPKFCLRINWRENGARASDPDLLHNEGNFHAIMEVLNAMVTEWLSTNHFNPRKRPRLSQRKSGATGAIAASSPKRVEREVSLGLVKDIYDPQNKRGRNSSTPGNLDEARSAARSSKGPGRQQMGLEVPKRYQNFSSWSRIKSSSPLFLDKIWAPSEKEGPTPNQNVVSQYTTKDDASVMRHKSASVDDDATCTLPAIEITPHVDTGTSTSLGETATADPMTFWEDPKTRTKYTINARTGWVVPETPARPLSAPVTTHDLGTTLPLISRRVTRWHGNQEAECSELPAILKDWENPVFHVKEREIPQICFSNSIHGGSKQDNKQSAWRLRGELKGAFKNAAISTTSKITREALKAAEIIAQVDKKFILARLSIKEEEVISDDRSCDRLKTLLVLIDQHAADERCRVEQLLKQLCEPTSNSESYRSKLGYSSRIVTTLLENPILVPVLARETELARSHAAHFANWGILYEFMPSEGAASPSFEPHGNTLAVKTLPPAIAERCKLEPKLLVKLFRSELWKVSERSAPPKMPGWTSSGEHLWLSRLSECPAGVLDMVNSRACRSAIMFHDPLNREECESLVQNLANCVFPFQCAHGRPSMVPLVDLGATDQDSQLSGFADSRVLGTGDSAGMSFKASYRKWKAGR